jgi:hypothetical protein
MRVLSETPRRYLFYPPCQNRLTSKCGGKVTRHMTGATSRTRDQINLIIAILSIGSQMFRALLASKARYTKRNCLHFSLCFNQHNSDFRWSIRLHISMQLKAASLKLRAARPTCVQAEIQMLMEAFGILKRRFSRSALTSYSMEASHVLASVKQTIAPARTYVRSGCPLSDGPNYLCDRISVEHEPGGSIYASCLLSCPSLLLAFVQTSVIARIVP